MPSRAEILARPAAHEAVSRMIRERHDRDPDAFHADRLRGRHQDCALCGTKAKILASALEDGDDA